MANKDFPTIPGTIDIPDNLNDFKTRQQVVWTASDWSRTNGVNIGYGPAAGDYWGGDDNFQIKRQANMYQPQQGSGFMVFTSATKERTTVFEMTGNSRWMPASVFNGIGFESLYQHNAGNKDHMLYIANYAVIFRHRTGSGTRYYGWNTGNTASPGHDKYRFDRIRSGASDINTIRAWGSDWLYQGLVVVLKTQGGGNTNFSESYITIYNMKVGSKFSTVDSQYRYLPLKNRSASYRDGSVGIKGISNPFEV